MSLVTVGAFDFPLGEISNQFVPSDIITALSFDPLTCLLVAPSMVSLEYGVMVTMFVLELIFLIVYFLPVTEAAVGKFNVNGAVFGGIGGGVMGGIGGFSGMRFKPESTLKEGIEYGVNEFFKGLAAPGSSASTFALPAGTEFTYMLLDITPYVYGIGGGLAATYIGYGGASKNWSIPKLPYNDHWEPEKWPWE